MGRVGVVVVLRALGWGSDHLDGWHKDQQKTAKKAAHPLQGRRALRSGASFMRVCARVCVCVCLCVRVCVPRCAREAVTGRCRRRRT